MPAREVIARLLATPAVSTMVADRIRTGKLDAYDAKPAVIVEDTDEQPVNGASGPTGTVFQTVSVGCVGSTYSSAKALTDAVKDALAGWVSPPMSMCQVTDIAYEPAGADVDQDMLREMFVVTCRLQYST
jgi:hypothetical protein